MNKNERPSFLKGRGAAVGIVICFVAVIALVGVYTFNNYQKDIDEQMAKAEKQADELTEDKTEETTADDIVLPEAEDKQDGTETADDVAYGTTDGQDSADSGSAGGAETSGADTSGVWFSEDSVLTWPASGAVIMGYSMDQTVFFQTLEQYKYNPAMIIGGEVGETITASAAGIVTNIEETAQTGTTVSLDMGNGYTAVYGQLTDVPLSTGDYVNAGEMIGTLNEPTKYYSVEGPNLYFEILKDGEPVDPMNFME
ncbi:M23 family metallopeptidase [[Ruminococcus] torques]|uniref:M23 family metallopeptidase n=1 Tax=[Ruminococcus] torques TaxID=33039 RepID=UPI0025A4BF6C|nr:M23 family metallopeptidase [[Ruminococcus] torques]MDM8235966.1 M23 family metallopeptidase [[Ruminococcus] torques]